VWKRFARTSDLGEFARPTAHGGGIYAEAYDAAFDPIGAAIVGLGTNTSALACLNALIADALDLVPDVLTYLSLLRDPNVFRFSAIPQVMAIATLDECFDNPKVFTGVVKISKGAAARLILGSGDLASVHSWFYYFADAMERRCPPSDPSREAILRHTASIKVLTAAKA